MKVFCSEKKVKHLWICPVHNHVKWLVWSLILKWPWPWSDLELDNLVGSEPQKLYMVGFSNLVNNIICGCGYSWSCALAHWIFGHSTMTLNLQILLVLYLRNCTWQAFHIWRTKLSTEVVVHGHALWLIWPLTKAQWPWTCKSCLEYILETIHVRLFKFGEHEAS